MIKDPNNLSTLKKTRLDMLPINDVTWPEISLRYMLISIVTLSVEFSLESTEMTYKEIGRVFIDYNVMVGQFVILLI